MDGSLKKTTRDRIMRAVAASQKQWEDLETDIRLDMALGKPEDVSAYQDCISAARVRRVEAP